jgi:hypothetical protein
MTDPAPGRRLGRRPPKRAPALQLFPSLTGIVPDHPASADHFASVEEWILGRNDEFGTCGPTSEANSRLLTTVYLTPDKVHRPTDDNVIDLYRRSGNPLFDPDTGENDNGVDLQTMLEASLSGGIGGVKPVCFAQVDHTDRELILAAEAIFGSVILGVILDQVQQEQTNDGLWDYRQSPMWGGHAIMSGRYSDPDGTEQDRTGVITWATVVDATDRFLDLQLEEAWVVIWPEHLGSTAFQQGVDLAILAADYKALTGREFPVQPIPRPGPGPGRVPDAADRALASVAKKFLTGHAGHRSMGLALQRWMAARGLDGR